jgi:hypothetical protein
MLHTEFIFKLTIICFTVKNRIQTGNRANAADHHMLKSKIVKRVVKMQIYKNRNTWKVLEVWCWRRMETISWTDHVRNKEVLLRVKEQRNILQEIRKRKANWIGYILRRNCLLQRVIEGKIKCGMK